MGEVGPGSCVVMTRAGAQSLNLQALNNVIVYDIPFSLGVFIQVVGRVTRLNTKYDQFNVYFIEVDGTIDSYKRMLIQDRMNVIEALFGGDDTIPIDVKELDRTFIREIRRDFLWSLNELKRRVKSGEITVK